jgi:hypothetical protein
MASPGVQAAGKTQIGKAGALADPTVKTSPEGDLVKPATTSSSLLGG